MQFLVVAYDGDDDDALARRMAAREAHLANVRRLAAEGKVIVGGALLNDDGQMNGSAVIADFPSRAELDEWLRTDPYVTGDVWRRIEVRTFRAAQLSG